MTIFELGALGEFVGAIGVIATLIFLSYQVLQVNRNARLSGHQMVLSNFYGKIWHFAENQELRKLVTDALNSYDDLDPDAKWGFDSLQMWYFGNLYQGLQLREHGLLDEESLKIISDAFVSSLLTPGGQQYWQQAKRMPNIPQSLIQYIEGCLADPETLPTPWTDALEHLKR